MATVGFFKCTFGFIASSSLYSVVILIIYCKGGGTGPAGPVLAGPLFQRASKTFEQTKNKCKANKY